MALLEPTATRLNLDIKAPPPGHDVAGAVVRILRRFEKSRDYLISSFDLDALLAVQAVAPEIDLAYTGRTSASLDVSLAHGFQWYHPKATVANSALVERAHAGGLKVNVWTVDDVDSIDHWRSVGADKICTNRPAAMMAAASRPGRVAPPESLALECEAITHPGIGDAQQ